jgi:hypothetical protein
VPKRFCLLDVAASSHTRVVGTTMTCTARVLAFDNLGDESSPDVREAPSPANTMVKLMFPLPSVSGELFHFSFAIFHEGPDNFFCRLYPACTLARFAVGEPR